MSSCRLIELTDDDLKWLDELSKYSLHENWTDWLEEIVNRRDTTT